MDGGVGAKLREARLQRGLNLDQVEAATKIRVRFLDAIENEEWDRLPGEFYARSFLRAYADHLGVDDVGAAELQEVSVPAATEPLPRIDPAPPEEAHFGQRRQLSPRLFAAIATAGLVAVLVAVELSAQSGDSTAPPQTTQRGDGNPQRVGSHPDEQSPQGEAGSSLTLTATAEVWVCLIDERGQALIDGEILGPGSEEGPYRSNGFTLSLGNGAVTMSVEGQVASVPPTPNPIGFAIDRDGTMRQLSEGERPTCA